MDHSDIRRSEGPRSSRTGEPRDEPEPRRADRLRHVLVPGSPADPDYRRGARLVAGPFSQRRLGNRAGHRRHQHYSGAASLLQFQKDEAGVETSTALQGAPGATQATQRESQEERTRDRTASARTGRADARGESAAGLSAA